MGESRESFPVISGSGSECEGPSEPWGKQSKEPVSWVTRGTFILQLVCEVSFMKGVPVPVQEIDWLGVSLGS